MTMSNLISRKDAIDIMNAKGDVAQETLLPLRHGHWIQAVHNRWFSYIKCSKCKRYLRDIHPSDYKFCPYCGAKMDEE